MMRIGLGVVITRMIASMPAALMAAPMDVSIEEYNTSYCIVDNDTVCRISYHISMAFSGETGTWELYEAPLGIMPALSDEIMEASGGNVPKIGAVLLPQESSMKVITYENNDAENREPPEPRFPIGPGGLGVATAATIGWIIGDDIYLNAGFVGAGICGYFACWDNDDKISATQPQPAGCTPFSGGDSVVYVIPAAQFRSNKDFVIKRDFITGDDDAWFAHSIYIIKFNPGK
jgi:hypothetical protein